MADHIISSILTGNDPYPVTQEWGNIYPGAGYGYTALMGMAQDAHGGIDVGVPDYTPLYAQVGGTVIESGFNQYFRPNPVYIKTDTGEIHIYGHMGVDAVSVGDHVTAGTYLGTSFEQTEPGTMTPDGSGPHVHFERRTGDNLTILDPLPTLVEGEFTPGQPGKPGTTTVDGKPVTVGSADMWTPVKKTLDGFATRGALFLAGGVLLAVGVVAFTGGGPVANVVEKVLRK